MKAKSRPKAALETSPRESGSTVQRPDDIAWHVGGES